MKYICNLVLVYDERPVAVLFKDLDFGHSSFQSALLFFVYSTISSYLGLWSF